MALTHRVERVAEQVREEVSQILATEVADPGVGLVTVTRVKVTPDLSLARVYWTLLGDAAERKKTAKALQRASSFVRHLLAERLTLRRAPEVVFQFDEGLAAHARVEQILHELHEEEAQRARAGGGDEAPADAPPTPTPDDDTPRS
ncbi:MAG: 30S ribosome-binding factor RbfA [Vicinamibacterales bacterium]